MNRALARCIVGSLRVTGSSEEALGGLRSFGQADWERTFSWLDDSGLALYLLNQVERAGADGVLPGPVRDRLKRNQASNRRRVAAMKREFEFFNHCFAAAGVEFAALKGFALVPDFCPDAELRLQYDFDYLVRPDCEQSARLALQETGYAPKNPSPGHQPEGETLFTSEPLGFPAANQDFYSASLPRRIEIHLGLWEPAGDGVRLRLPGDELQRSRPVEWEGIRFPALAVEDALLFQVLHAFHHLLDHWCRPSCFFEIAYFMESWRSDTSFWDRFQSRVEGRGKLHAISGLVFSMAEALFGAPLPDAASRWMERNPALGLWVREYGERWALAPYPGSKLGLLIHGEFIDDPALWRKVRRSRLLPLHRPARVAEPVGEGAASRWAARSDQWRSVAGRVRFHLGAMLDYAWHLPRWNRVMRRDSRRSEADA